MGAPNAYRQYLLLTEVPVSIGLTILILTRDIVSTKHVYVKSIQISSEGAPNGLALCRSIYRSKETTPYDVIIVSKQYNMYNK